MTVPPMTIVNNPMPDPLIPAAKPNWIQDAEAIAKADIKRLEGKFARVCNTAMGTMIVAFLAFLMASIALFKACR